jgi:hypothetical protein
MSFQSVIPTEENLMDVASRSFSPPPANASAKKGRSKPKHKAADIPNPITPRTRVHSPPPFSAQTSNSPSTTVTKASTSPQGPSSTQVQNPSVAPLVVNSICPEVGTLSPSHPSELSSKTFDTGSSEPPESTSTHPTLSPHQTAPLTNARPQAVIHSSPSPSPSEPPVPPSPAASVTFPLDPDVHMQDVIENQHPGRAEPEPEPATSQSSGIIHKIGVKRGHNSENIQSQRKRPRGDKSAFASSAAPSSTRVSLTASSIPTSMTPAVPISLEPPPQMPEKLLQVLDMFKTVKDDKWDRLLSNWLAFETSHQFSGRPLAGSHRPTCIGDWISRARSVKWRPPPSKSIASDFLRWWSSMQPDFRTTDDGYLLRDDDGAFVREEGDISDWATLCQAGTNGVVSVVAGLFFWHYLLPALQSVTAPGFRQKAAATRARKEWEEAVDDVCWVIGRLHCLAVHK